MSLSSVSPLWVRYVNMVDGGLFPGLDVEDKGVCACLPLIMSLFFHNPTTRKQGKF